MKDPIERQAAIDVLGVRKEVLSRVLDDTDAVVGREREKYLWGLGLIEAYINDMKELPPAQPERKKGDWIKLYRGTIAEGLHCSVCGKHGYRSDFCPNCGADMRGEVNR